MDDEVIARRGACARLSPSLFYPWFYVVVGVWFIFFLKKIDCVFESVRVRIERVFDLIDISENS